MLHGVDRDDLSFDREDEDEKLQDVPEAGGDQQPHPFGVHRDLVANYVRTAAARAVRSTRVRAATTSR
ncbi:hypothetical protein [Streptomyces bicolor]|uniref:hypothetical protein n=1 Tax=Streptomyces bicolor TaxID=66874 RepID=UPI000AEAC48E|nr:hypothetical protein [Streptomyces bicolor]